jgi:hypothetical protein
VAKGGRNGPYFFNWFLVGLALLACFAHTREIICFFFLVGLDWVKPFSILSPFCGSFLCTYWGNYLLHFS